jgi:hypothetical protein
MPATLSKRFKLADFDENDADTAGFLHATRQSLTDFTNQTLQYMFNGNGATAIPPFMALMQWIDAGLNLICGWETVPASRMPPRIMQKVQRAEHQLGQIQPDLQNIQKTVATIRAAQAVSDDLHVTLQDLKHAEKELRDLSKNGLENFGLLKNRTESAADIVEDTLKRRAEVDELLKKCRDALSASTTVSLAQSFSARALKLENSLTGWIWRLAFALAVAMAIGSYNFYHIDQLLRSENVQPMKLGAYVVFAVLSIGAPVWFAWMSTKQISQRFKLAEDYAFKAAVASAYEGYKRETAEVDPVLSQRLLGSALTRLDENPLRYVEEHNYGSPAHEFANSTGAKGLMDKLIDKVPGFGGGKDAAE